MFPTRANEISVKKPFSMLIFFFFWLAVKTGANMALDRLPVLHSCPVTVLAVAEMA